ncbi:hypothetical protein [Konateibacter massiliensis]|uniref:hypothetical protein n=1 Tax=Konateibacter massiliensis TaxID=2002841 RepID=UPI000C15DA26|nr:hypothetical protein [Konateibacter massiliensis]
MNLLIREKTEKTNEKSSMMITGFLVVELLLYLGFLALDLGGKSVHMSNVLKYISIWGCFCFLFCSYLIWKDREIFFMSVVLLFTVTADTFLLFTNRFEIGVFFFILVQVLYSRRIKRMCGDGCRKYMAEALGVVFFWNIMIVLLKNESYLTPVIAITGLYFAIFTGNMLRIWIQAIREKKERGEILGFVIGLTLFYLCDICVGLNYLHTTGAGLGILKAIAAHAWIFMWIFYLPAQVILSIHGVIYGREAE